MKLSVVFEFLDRATTPMKRTEQSFRSFGRSVNLVQSCLWKTNQVAELLGRAGDVMGRLMQPGVEFEQSMANLSSITGIVGKDLERLGRIARTTGVSSGLGASGAADAFALLASQIDVSKIGMDGLIELQSKTITLAQASGMSMTEAANSMAGTINQFGLQANQAGRIINVLAAGSKYGAAEIPQLSESFKVVGAAANAAGLSVESTAGAIEVLSKNNLKGAEAGTALRNIVLKMQTAMGVDFSKTSLQEALIKLKPHLKDATYMSKLFGMENVAAAQFLVANTELLEEMTTRVTNTNVAQEQAAIRTNTWSQRIKEQMALFNDWMIGVQQNFGGVMYAFQVVGQSLNMFLSLAPFGKLLSGIGSAAWSASLGVIKFGRTIKLLALAKHTGSTFAFARAIASCGMMGRVAAAGIGLWSKVTAVASFIQGGFMKVLRGMRLVMMSSVLPALWGVISATWAWTAALLANPIVLVVMAIVGLIAAVVLCWKKFAGFRAVIYTIWDTIKGFGKALVDFLVTPFKVVWRIISGVGKAIYKLFTGDFKGAGEEFSNAFKGGFDEASEGLKKSVNGVRKTATGISGNYKMHLTEERAKQAEKENKEKEKREVANVPELKVEGVEGMKEKDVVLQPEVFPNVQAQSAAGRHEEERRTTISEKEVYEVPDVRIVAPANHVANEASRPKTLWQQVEKTEERGADSEKTEVKLTAPTVNFSGLAEVKNYAGGGSNGDGNREVQKVEINFQPNVNVSAELTQKTKDDFLSVLRSFGDEITKMVEEVQRRNGRGAYAVS